VASGEISGGVSGELVFYFIFVDKPFCYNEAKTVFFLLPGSKKDTWQHGNQEARKSNPRRIPSTALPFFGYVWKDKNKITIFDISLNFVRFSFFFF
jgi:hypothetical protein